MSAQRTCNGTNTFTLFTILGSLPARAHKLGQNGAWLLSGLVVLISMTGCQLVDMARFSYANANATHQWANEQHTTSIPFTLVDNHIILPVRVNGSEHLNFVLDSGAGATVIIDSRSSRALKLEMGGELPVSGAGEGSDSSAHIVADTSLSVGDVSLKGLSVIYLPLASIPFFDDLDDVYFDGVIGAPFFSRFIVDIDYDQRLITFTEPSAAEEGVGSLGQGWSEVPLQIEAGVPYMTAQFDAGRGEPIEVKLLVDTGFRGALSLTPQSHSGLNEPTEYFQSIDQGLSGDIVSHVAVSGPLTLAEYKLNGLPVSYAIAGGEGDADSHGILGNRVLQQFNLVFDYPNKRMLLTPNRSFNAPIRADRSGLQIRPHAAGGVVKGIAPGSTGQSSPLQVGDIITTFDDTPVTYQTIGELKRTLESDRQSVHLCWLSGPAQHCRDLPLASRLSSYYPPDSLPRVSSYAAPNQ